MTLAQNGARHTVGSLSLGSSVDTETDGVPSRNASSDSGDDGVFVLADMVASATSATISSVSVIVSACGRLDAWIDFNQDGDWLDLGEQIFASFQVTAGLNVLSYQIPAGAKAGEHRNGRPGWRRSYAAFDQSGSTADHQ